MSITQYGDNCQASTGNGATNTNTDPSKLVEWFKSLFDKPKRSVIPLTPGVSIKSVDTSKGFIVVTLSTGEVVCRKANSVHATNEYVIFD